MTVSNYDLSKMAAAASLVLPLENICMANEIERVYKNRLKQNDHTYVINSAPAGSSGAHWTILLIRGDKAVHFDSYGGVPPKEVMRLARIHGLMLCSNAFIIQSLSSTNCGLFCFALLQFERTYKQPHVKPATPWGIKLYEMVNDYVNLYVADVSKNDDILHKVMQSFAK